MAPFSGSFGLPLCLSDITNPLAFSKEVSDHDQRRKMLKKLKHEHAECFWPSDQLTGAEIKQYHGVLVVSDEYNSEEEVAGDLADVVRDLSSLTLSLSSSFTAKAA